MAEQSTRCVKTRESCLTSLPGNTASPGGRVAGSRLHSPVNTHVHTHAPVSHTSFCRFKPENLLLVRLGSVAYGGDQLHL